jgi:hypothetical protein
MPMQGLQSLFALLEIPFDFTEMGAKSYHTQKPNLNLRNDFAYWLTSFQEIENRTSMNFFRPAIR